MKKNYLWSVFVISMMTFMSVGFVSCGDDDDDDGFEIEDVDAAKTMLYGTWSLAYEEGWDAEEPDDYWKEEIDVNSGFYSELVFNRDGSVEYYNRGYDGDPWPVKPDLKGEFEIVNGYLILNFRGYQSASNIKSLTNKQLVLETDDEDGYSLQRWVKGSRRADAK